MAATPESMLALNQNSIESKIIETNSDHPIQVRCFDETAYQDSFAAMSQFATQRAEGELDQIWLLQHSPVYTLGTACQMDTLLPSDIPMVDSDRGGQITYHGLGQIIMYPLLKLRRYGLGVKALVSALEQSVIDTLNEYGVVGERRQDAPGVYVNGEKIAALGLRIRKGTCYHGLSFNIDMDLSPFGNIDPCGYQNLRVTQLSNLVEGVALDDARDRLLRNFIALI